MFLAFIPDRILTDKAGPVVLEFSVNANPFLFRKELRAHGKKRKLLLLKHLIDSCKKTVRLGSGLYETDCVTYCNIFRPKDLRWPGYLVFEIQKRINVIADFGYMGLYNR